MDKTKERYLLVDAAIANQTSLRRLRENNLNQIRVVPKSENGSRILDEIHNKEHDTIHIICHGNAHKLLIGTGIDVKHFLEQKTEQSKQKHIVLWACNAGEKIDQGLANTLRVTASKNKLGRGSTLEGFEDITSAVRELEIELDTSERWESADGLLSSEYKPIQDEQTGRFRFPDDAEVQLLGAFELQGISYSKGTQLTGLTSDKEDFSSWQLTAGGNSNPIKFTLPAEILKKGADGNVEAIINVENGSIKSWSIEIQSQYDLVDIAGIKINEGSIKITYDVEEKIYTIYSGVQLDPTSNPVAKYLELSPTNISGEIKIRSNTEDKDQESQSNIPSWSIQGFNFGGDFSVDFFGLGSLGGTRNSKIGFERSKSEKPDKSDKNTNDGLYSIQGIKAGGIFEDITLPSISFNLTNGKFRPGPWTIGGKLNFDIPGLDMGGAQISNIVDDDTSKDEDNNILKLGNFKLPLNQPFFDKLPSIKSLKLKQNPANNRWSVDSWSVNGKIPTSKLIPGINLPDNITVGFHRDAKNQPIFSAKDITVTGNEGSKSIFSNASLNNLEFFQDNKTWRIKNIEATGAIGSWFNALGLNFSDGMKFAYDYNDGESIYELDGALKTFEDQVDSRSLFKSGTLRDFKFGYINNEWKILGWEAEGEMALDLFGISLKTPKISFKLNELGVGEYSIGRMQLEGSGDNILGEGELEYLKFAHIDGKWLVNNWAANGNLELNIPGVTNTGIKASVQYQPGEYRIEELSLTTYAGSVFNGDIKICDLIIKDQGGEAIANDNESNYFVDSYTADGSLGINIAGDLKFDSQLSVRYDSNIGYQTSGSLEANGSSSFLGKGEVNDLRIEQVEEDGNMTWKTISWDAKAEIGIDLPGINLDGQAEVSFDSSNGEQYTVKNATLAVDAESIFAVGATLNEMIITENPNAKDSDASKWIIENWNGTGALNIGSDDFNLANAKIDVSYEQGIYTVDGTLSTTNNLFKGEANISDMKIVKDGTNWEIQSWNAVGKLGFEIDGLDLNSDATVKISYKKGEKEGDKDQYLLGGELDVEAGGIFAGNVTAEDVKLTKANNEWDVETGKFTGNVNIETPIGEEKKLTVSGRTTLDYQHDSSTKQTIFRQDQKESDLKIESPQFNSEANIGFARIDNGAGQAYFKYLTGAIGETSIDVGELKFKIPNTGIEFGFAQNPVQTGNNINYETIYAVNGGVDFNLIPGLEVNLQAGDRSTMQEAMESFYENDGFTNLQKSNVSDAQWNIGNIKGSAAFGDGDSKSTTLDLGIVEIQDLSVSSGINIGDKTNPFGLFKYSGVNRTVEKPQDSIVSVNVKDITPKINIFKNLLPSFAEKLEIFTDPLKLPVDQLLYPHLGNVYKKVDSAIDDVFNEIPSVIWGLFPDSWDPRPVTVGTDLGRKIGNNIASVVDNIYLIRSIMPGSNIKPINLASKLQDTQNFIQTISMISKKEGKSSDKQDDDTDATGKNFPKFENPLLSFEFNPKTPGVFKDNTQLPSPSMPGFGWNPDIPSFTSQSDQSDQSDQSEKSNKISFPAIGSIGGISGLLKNIFLTPDKAGSIDLMEINFAKKVDGKPVSFESPFPGFKITTKTGMGMNIKTTAGIEMSGNQLLEIFRENPIDSLERIIADYSYWDLGNTSAKFEPSVELNAGFELLNENYVESFRDGIEPFSGWAGWDKGHAIGAMINIPITGGIEIAPKNKEKVSLRQILDSDISDVIGIDIGGDAIKLITQIAINYAIDNTSIKVFEKELIKPFASNQLQNNWGQEIFDAITGIDFEMNDQNQPEVLTLIDRNDWWEDSKVSLIDDIFKTQFEGIDLFQAFLLYRDPRDLIASNYEKYLDELLSMASESVFL